MAKKKYTSDIFISYASEDLETGVADIFMALFEVGITSSWIDRLVIQPGDSIPMKVDEGLNSTRYLLPIITKTYFTKEWTQVELDAVNMLSKPAIPIWVGVTPKEVSKFSPTLAAQKAIIFDDNPYVVAEEVAGVLIHNRRTHFYKQRDRREEARVFWMVCYLYILHCIEGKNLDDEVWGKEFAEPDPQGATMRGNVEEAITMPPEDMLRRSRAYRQAAEDLGNIITDEDIAHIICGEIKRKLAWFPYEPREHIALKKIGVDRF